MISYEPRFRLFAMCLSGLAGYVDATGFILTHGLFVSFMSGNSTRLAVAFAHDRRIAAFAGTLILLFLVGVILGAIIAALSRARRKSFVSAFASFILFASAMAATIGPPIAAASLLAISMGSLNNIFLKEGEVSIGVTYMTGTLVRAGQRMAAAIRGDEPSDWQPYLLLWASLVAGAATGAAIAAASAALSLWIATAVASALSLWANWLKTPN